MRTLPVQKLTADIIELGGKLLVNENGDLYYNDKLIAKYEDLIGVNMVSNKIELDMLRPKMGDVAKRLDTSEMMIWNGVWQPMYREKIKVHMVSRSEDLQFLNAIAGDMANVTLENLTSVYLGDGNWTNILTGLTGTIDDNVISLYSTWSSSQIDYKLKNHDHDGGVY